MKYVVETIAEAAESMQQVKRSLLKRFKPGLSSKAIELTNKQLDGVRLSIEALDRITPVIVASDGTCPECGRNLDKIYEAAEDDIIYCCPFCGQALWLDSDLEEAEREQVL